MSGSDLPGLEAWIEELDHGDQQALRAVTELAGRTGAREFQFSCQYPEKAYTQRSWWAFAKYQGARLTADGHSSAHAACDALAKRMLDGGQCTGCHKMTFVHNEGGYMVPDAAAAARAKREGLCRWTRGGGERWTRECGDCAPAGSTREKLAMAMAAVAVIPAGQIAATRAGRYDEYLSDDTAFPLMLLVDELRPYGAATAGLIAQVMEGGFDASAQESNAWAASADGKAAFAELASGLANRQAHGGKARRRQRKRKK